MENKKIVNFINKFFLIVICIYTQIVNPFKIVEYFKQYNNKKVVYKLLKQQNLINKNITFVNVPWELLERNKIFSKHPNLSDLPNFKVENGFTICRSDNANRFIPLLKSIGIKVLFAPAGYNIKEKNFELVTLPYRAMSSGDPKNKNIFYSFIGSITTCSCRDIIFNMKHPQNCVIIKREGFFGGSDDPIVNQKRRLEYIDILTRSRFSLCPKGRAPGTFRFWESLRAGAIPVLISDNYKLPPGFDWSSCIVKVKESEMTKIPEILSKISQHKEKEMRKNCLKAYKLYSGNNFYRVIGEYFK